MTISESLFIYEADLRDKNRKPKTFRNFRTSLSSLIGVIGDIDISFLGMDHIIQWKMAMREEGKSDSTRNTYLCDVRSLLKVLAKNEIRVLEPHYLKSEKEVKKPHTWLMPDEVEQLVDAATTSRNKAIIAAFFGTGCRLSELLNIDRRTFEEAPEVDPGIYEIWVCGKGDKYRPVYYTAEVRNRVLEYLETRTDTFAPLFISAQNRRLGPSSVEAMIHTVTRQTNLNKRITPHVFRHSYVSDLASSGVPIPAISKLVGHASSNTTLGIYTHILDKQAKDAFAAHHARK